VHRIHSPGIYNSPFTSTSKVSYLCKGSKIMSEYVYLILGPEIYVGVTEAALNERFQHK
jgi:hypothetical protein